MIYLNAEALKQSLPMTDAIDAMRTAFAALSSGKTVIPQRFQLPIDFHQATMITMPGYVNFDGCEISGVKNLHVNPLNINKPTIHGTVLLHDPNSGEPIGLLDGGALTAIRTGAASGLATELLSRRNSKVLTIFGAGVQARTQIEAVCAVREIKKIWIFSRDINKSKTLIHEMRNLGRVPKDVEMLAASEYDKKKALNEADIICTATYSEEPLFEYADIKPGVHINAVGAYTPQMQEISSDIIIKSKVFVDSNEAAHKEAGDLIKTIKKGMVASDHIFSEIGMLLLKKCDFDRKADDITLFKSVGIMAQDLTSGKKAIDNAKKLNLGIKLPK